MSASKLHLDDPRPPYVQIAEQIRKAIKDETLEPGEKLGSVRVLAEQYEVSAGTIQQALKVLRDERLIVSWQGRGVFVRNPAYDIEEDEKAVDARTLISQLDAVLDRVEQLEREVGNLNKRFQTLVAARSGRAAKAH